MLHDLRVLLDEQRGTGPGRKASLCSPSLVPAVPTLACWTSSQAPTACKWDVLKPWSVKASRQQRGKVRFVVR